MLAMDQFAQTLTQPWMVYIFVGIILLVALIPLYQAILGIGAVNKDLNKAITVLTKLGTVNQQEQFFNLFKGINNQISRIEGLRHAWREFVYSMYFANTAANKKAYLSHRPSHYFNRDSVLGKRLNLSQFFAYPNYLIGIGLTFTFIGLAAALHVAQAGLANGGGQQALKDLLAVASIKFISSIAGIFSSLVISAIQRTRIRTFQQELARFCDLLEECTEYKSTEKLLHDNLQEQQKHTAILNNIAPTIANGIGEALSEQLSAGVANALEPLLQDVRALAYKFTGNCEDALKKILEEFLNQLRKSSVDDLQGLTDNVRMLKNSLDKLMVNMQSTGIDFAKEIESSATQLNGIIKNIAESFAPLQNGIGQFGQSLSSLETVATNIEHAGSSISNAAEENKKTASAMAMAADDFRNTVAAIERAGVHVRGNTLDPSSANTDSDVMNTNDMQKKIRRFAKIKSWWV